MKTTLVASLALAIAYAVGCTSAGTELFTEGTPPDGGDAGSTTTTTSSGQGAGGAGAGTTSSSGVGGHGGDGGDGASGGQGGETALLDCGNTQCKVAKGSACCWDEHEEYDPPQAECVTGPIATDGCQTAHPTEADQGLESRIECQNSSHCDQGVCCAHRGYDQSEDLWFYFEVVCAQSCEWNEDGVLLCDSLQDSASCPMLPTQGGGTIQGECKQSQLLPNDYIICGYPG